MILLIDNYDSFSYNLVQLVGTVNSDVKVIRNDALSVSQIKALEPTHILLSPGPGYPQNAGVCIETVARLGRSIPMLGVCLGHQAICQAFGATISHAKQLMHGKQSNVCLDPSCPIFHDMPKKIEVARYHSLAARTDTIPDCLVMTAATADHEIMAVMHREYPIYGVQFHPESILTPNGMQIIRNFLALGKE